MIFQMHVGSRIHSSRNLHYVSAAERSSSSLVPVRVIGPRR